MKVLLSALIFILLFSTGFAQNASFQKGQRVYVTATSLIVRKAPEKTADRLTSVLQGAAVQIVELGSTEETIAGVTARWYRVKASTGEGWVFGGYLSSVNPVVSGGGQSGLDGIYTAIGDAGCVDSGEKIIELVITGDRYILRNARKQGGETVITGSIQAISKRAIMKPETRTVNPSEIEKQRFGANYLNAGAEIDIRHSPEWQRIYGFTWKIIDYKGSKALGKKEKKFRDGFIPRGSGSR